MEEDCANGKMENASWKDERERCCQSFAFQNINVYQFVQIMYNGEGSQGFPSIKRFLNRITLV